MLRLFAHGRYLLFLALVFALLFAPLVSAQYVHARNPRSVLRRDGINFPSIFSSPTNTNTATTSSPTDTKTTDAKTTQTTTSNTVTSTSDSSTSTTSTPTSTSPTTNTDSTSSPGDTSTTQSPQQTTTTSQTNSPTNTDAQTTSSTTPPAAKSSVVTTSLTTNADGQTSVVYVTVPAASAAVSAPNPSATSSNASSSGLSVGGIVGLAVAGGVVLISVLAFAIFKFSRKRYLDEYDDGEFFVIFEFLGSEAIVGNVCYDPMRLAGRSQDGNHSPYCSATRQTSDSAADHGLYAQLASQSSCRIFLRLVFFTEAIKWPELNASHGDNLHALPTHRTGGSGFETSSEVNLARPDSRAGSIAPSAANSAADLFNQHDPYAVPPLPHLNPSVGGVQPYRDDPSAGYYDPYSGPVPNTLDGEAIPMTQIGGRARSPMPGGMGMEGGRMSPAPGMAGGRMSPAPSVALGPPMSGMRAVSPGPGAGYGAGAYGI
ncbi:uncharacterized protein FIBRA_05742 [Fibroporia radiculosa]|uniref:Mid2 domain-containing protein n=1 Tax=Fibroporia radiculosa TaxID=599839 RepID=J4H3P5_9APHY|nr:uncharacterized protein FIBRA_05742 [Fibroporia radiculosa]CCM03604.1 predicted protein [Fibroporia radiculosa]